MREIAALLFPFVGALQVFAVDYGYRGFSKDAALLHAGKIYVILFFISFIWFIFYHGL